MGCFGCKSKKPSAPATPKKCKLKRKVWTAEKYQKQGWYLDNLATPKRNFQLELLSQVPKERKVPLYTLCPRINWLACPKPTFGPNIYCLTRRCYFGSTRRCRWAYSV